MLAEVKKQANKENKKEIASEASKAHELMFNIAKHINVYTEDYKHIRTLMELRLEMDWYSMKSDEEFVNKFRRLIFEIPDIEVKAGREDFKPFHLYVFEAHIMAFEEEVFTENLKDNNGKVKVTLLGDAIKTIKKKNKFYNLYEINKFDLIHLKQENLIELAAFKSAIKLKEKSLEIRFRETGDRAQSFLEKIKELMKEAHPTIVASSAHQDHEYEFYKNSVSFVDGVVVDENEQDHVICAVCNNFLGGKIFTGIYCSTCDKYFHLGCFEKEPETPVPSPRKMRGEKEKDTSSSWNMGEIKEGDAKKMLRDKRRGTFLVRFSHKYGHHVLNTNNEGKEHRKILNVTIQGQEYYYIKEGFAYQTLQELIAQSREDYGLLFPVGSEDSNVLDEDDDIGRDEEDIEELINEDDINHGDISRDEAEKRLNSTGQAGYFLIRGNEDGWKLSYSSPRNGFGHQRIDLSQDGGFLLRKKPFSTILDIVKHYQENDWKVLKVSDLDRFNILPPGEIKRVCSSRSQTGSVNYYHGVLESSEAARLLSGKQEGSFLLRKNSENEYRITHKVCCLSISSYPLIKRHLLCRRWTLLDMSRSTEREINSQ